MSTGALFNRVKVWLFEEVLKSKDLNAEFDNILNHLSVPYLTADTNLSQLQTQKDPGGLGTEVIPTNLQDELNELKFSIARIAGQSFFYQAPSLTLADVNTLLKLGVGISNNRITSGKTVSTSTMADFLLADGSTPKVTLKAGGGNPSFVYVINGIQYTISADTSFMGMSLAPSTNNTAAIANFIFQGGFVSNGGPTAGETDAEELNNPSEIYLGTVGSNISSQANNFIALKNQTTGEYFFGFLHSDGLTLSNCFRGFFFDHTDAPIKRADMILGDVLQLMKLTWIFAKSDLTLDIIYTNPVYSATAPTSPSLGDYWFDLTNQQWKRFGGSGYVLANATLIGICIQDTTGTVGTRSFDFFAVFSELNTIRVDLVYSNSSVGTTKANERISVFGTPFDYGYGNLLWNNPANNESGLTVVGSAVYYLYITRTGLPIISDQKPYDRKYDLLGKYHPYNDWRCVGTIQTDGSAHFYQSYALGVIDSPSNIDEIDGLDIRRFSIQNTRLFPRGQGTSIGQVSPGPSSGNYSTSSTTFTDVGISESLFCKGGPVLIVLSNDQSGSASSISTISGGITVEFRILRDGAITVYQGMFECSVVAILPTSIVAIDLQPAFGNHTYSVEAKCTSGTLFITNSRLCLIEL